MDRIALSNRQAKEADRVGGIELLICWPPELGPEPVLAVGYERDATPAQKAYAEALVRQSCDERRLVPVHTRVCVAQRPAKEPRPREVCAHLAITIIGYRWVAARGRPAPLVMWA